MMCIFCTSCMILWRCDSTNVLDEVVFRAVVWWPATMRSRSKVSLQVYVLFSVIYTSERQNRHEHLDITGPVLSCLESLWGIKVENQGLPSAGQDCRAPQQAHWVLILADFAIERRNKVRLPRNMPGAAFVMLVVFYSLFGENE